MECNELSCAEKCGEFCQKLDVEPYHSEVNKFFPKLPPEIISNIFELCSLRDQLTLVKVCKLFRQVVRDICERRFKFFNYNYLTLKYTLQLQDDEITELCCLCGKAVERARFSTFFNMDMLQNIEWSGIRTNPIENLKYFINDNFKQNVKYFKNLKELDVQGKFLQDQTISALAKHCKKLKTLRLMDGDNRWLWGEHLHDLESIENLELKSCRNLDPNHLMAVSMRRQLKCLNIVECEHIKDIPKIITLCDHWHKLETLRLTAFSQDSQFLKVILNLPALMNLQFYWINFMPLNFEENFFLELELNKMKALQLDWIKFENDRYYIEDESLQQWSDEKYAIMRENVCINGQSWIWPAAVFDKISMNFQNFKNLRMLSFYYCRLLDYEQMTRLSLIIEKLELLKIYGCPKNGDEQFKKHWMHNKISSKCQLNLESFLPLKTVTHLQEEADSRQFSSYYRREPVLRSIECHFNIEKSEKK